jgi:hypothetical protein
MPSLSQTILLFIYQPCVVILVGLENQKTNNLQLTRYLSSLFLRPDEVCENDNFPINPSKHGLKIGHSYNFVIDCYAPHLSEEKISSMEIVGKSDPPLLGIRNVTASQDARLSINVLPTFSGETNLKIWVQPEQTRSSELEYRCKVELLEQDVKKTSPSTAQTQTIISVEQPVKITYPKDFGLSGVQAQTLYNNLLALLSKNSNQVGLPKFEIAHELEQFCIDDDGKNFLQEEQGIHANSLGHYDDAYRILNSIGIKKISSQEGIGAYFISAWETNKTPDINFLTDRLIVKENPELTKKIREALLRIWENLIDQQSVRENLFLADIFTKDNLREIIAPVIDGKIVVDWIEFTKENLEILDAKHAFHLLSNWLKQDKDTINDEYVARLTLKYGIENKEDVAFVLDQFKTKIISEKELDEAISYKQAASYLDTPQKIHFYESLTEITKQFDSDEWRIFTSELSMEMVRYYLSQPTTIENLELSGNAIQYAEKFADEKRKEELLTLKENWKKQSEETSIIKEYRSQFDEYKLSRLREIVHDKRILFIGGLPRGFDADNIAHEMGFSSGKYNEISREKRRNQKPITKQIKEGAFDYVIDIISFTPHHNEVKDACPKKVIYIMHTSRSFHKNTFLNELFEYHKIGNSSE